MPLNDGRYTGPLYRALNPVFARDPLSGQGAAIHGGRFNAKGTSTLYTALDPTTALREANQVGSLQPTVLVSYSADIGPIFDTRNVAALEQYDLSPQHLADPGWRTKMLDARSVPTQGFAHRLSVDGFAGLLTRSFAQGATASSLNIVLWRWTGAGCVLNVIDDENRLERM
jgi:RES domain-containing protein